MIMRVVSKTAPTAEARKDSLIDVVAYVEHEQFERILGPGRGKTVAERVRTLRNLVADLKAIEPGQVHPRQIDGVLWGLGWELAYDGNTAEWWWKEEAVRREEGFEEEDAHQWHRIPDVTSNVTLAIKLIEEVLPDCAYSLRREADISGRFRYHSSISCVTKTAGATGPTAALALLRAFLYLLEELI
jgi:hypothetical protein